jgi:hypothetical protein
MGIAGDKPRQSPIYLFVYYLFLVLQKLFFGFLVHKIFARTKPNFSVRPNLFISLVARFFVSRPYG